VELIRRHERVLAALVHYQISDRHHAEDVFQETLLQAWVGIGRVRDASKVRAWLLQVARNRCREFARSPQRRQVPAGREEISIHLDRYGRALSEAEDVAIEVKEALDEVPEPKRRIAKLFYLEGLTIAEIVRRAKFPEGTVKRHLYDARRRMRNTLGLPPRQKRKGGTP